MRTYLLAACTLAGMLGASTIATAQPVNHPELCVAIVNPQITALLAQFPAGGPALRAAIARAVEADPSLAPAVIFAARNANPAQKEAIGAGLADAANYYAKCGLDWCRGLEARIRTAMICADPGTRVGFISGSAPTLTEGIPGFKNAGATTNGCQAISPSRPGC